MVSLDRAGRARAGAVPARPFKGDLGRGVGVATVVTVADRTRLSKGGKGVPTEGVLVRAVDHTRLKPSPATWPSNLRKGVQGVAEGHLCRAAGEARGLVEEALARGTLAVTQAR